MSFGIKDKWVLKTFSGDVACTVKTFGADPYPGKVKKCAVGKTGAPSATPTPTPAATPAPTPAPKPTPIPTTPKLTPAPAPTPTATTTGPFGFAASVTGGAGGEVVRVTTPD